MKTFHSIHVKLSLFLCLILCALVCNSQVTQIPDPAFEQVLINLGLDIGSPDGSVLTSSIDTVTVLNIYSAGINDLSGIEDFSSLKDFDFRTNNIDSIDLSNNLELKVLFISQNANLVYIDLRGLSLLESANLSHNSLNRIDFYNNLSLSTLTVGYNAFTTFNLSEFPNLKNLNCGDNQISTLNLSTLTDLELLTVSNNKLTDLNLSQNHNLGQLYCTHNNFLECLNIKNGNNYSMTGNFAYNPNLFCIEVDDSNWSTTYWGSLKDPYAIYSENCNNTCSGATSIEDLNMRERELISVTDLLGRTTTVVPDKVLIYRYSDGTTEKKVIFDY